MTGDGRAFTCPNRAPSPPPRTVGYGRIPTPAVQDRPQASRCVLPRLLSKASTGMLRCGDTCTGLKAWVWRRLWGFPRSPLVSDSPTGHSRSDPLCENWPSVFSSHWMRLNQDSRALESAERCATKRADHERCALQDPGLTSHFNRGVANLSRDSVLVTLVFLFGSDCDSPQDALEHGLRSCTLVLRRRTYSRGRSVGAEWGEVNRDEHRS